MSYIGDILEAVKTTIVGLNLLGSPPIHVQKILTLMPKETLPMPCVLIAPVDSERAGPFGGFFETNESDLVTYPIGVYYVEVARADYTIDGAETHQLNRQRIRRAFNAKRLSGVTTVHQVNVEPQPLRYPGSFRNDDLDVSGLKLNVINKERRTLPV